MRIGFAPSIALLVVMACSRAQPPPASSFELCAEPRPQACTRDYRPVCAHLSDGSLSTYPNGCSACADAGVLGHRPDPCR